MQDVRFCKSQQKKPSLPGIYKTVLDRCDDICTELLAVCVSARCAFGRPEFTAGYWLHISFQFYTKNCSFGRNEIKLLRFFPATYGAGEMATRYERQIDVNTFNK